MKKEGHNGLSKKGVERRESYIDARVAGMSGDKARDHAGYPVTTNPSRIETSPYVRKSLIERAAEKGLDDNFLLDEYKEALKSCDDPKTAKLKDLNSKMQGLKQLGYLLGHGKQQPTVAVQINNNPRSSEDAALGSTADLLGEVRDTLEVIRKEMQNRTAGGVHVRSVELSDAQAPQEMGPTTSNESDAGGGGG